MSGTFRLDEMRTLYGNITARKTTLAKEPLLQALRAAVLTQRTLFGRSLTHTFASKVTDILKQSEEGISDSSRGRGGGNNNSSNSSNNINSTYNLALRINPGLLDLLRRCQRLYQISYNTPATATQSTVVGGTGSRNGGGGARGYEESLSCTGFASVLQPLEYNAPLMVLFHK
ncbi:hypothetical protein B484DRAFT_432821, partial [Ochromonadaceae sp. CCMP2298]